jgi:hypothetical protein
MAYFFPREKFRVNADQKVLGWILGDFFHKLIWSPCRAER